MNGSKLPTFEQCMIEVLEKRVNRRESECGNYCLFNYCEQVEYKNLWNDVNVWCRGIVYDLNTKKLVAVPFRKFWNLNQRPELNESVLRTKGEPTVYSKEDGSLGILFYNEYTKQLQVTTRGSFDSDQAKWATNWINSRSDDVKYHFENVLGTYLFEIVYPENQIVINYQGFSGLIYIQTTHFDDESYEFFHYTDYQNLMNQLGIRCVKSFPLNLSTAQSTLDNLSYNEEGYVLYYSDGTLVKLKGKEYLRVHRLRSNMTWSNVTQNALDFQFNFDQVANGLPDEFIPELRSMYNEFVDYHNQETQKFVHYMNLLSISSGSTKKDKALWIQANIPKLFHSAAYLYSNNQIIRAYEKNDKIIRDQFLGLKKNNEFKDNI